MFAEIKVLAVGATRPLLQHLMPEFQKSTGHKVAAWFGPPALISEKLMSGEAVDVIFSFEPKWSELVRSNVIERGVEIARVGIGVAVQKDAPKPELKDVVTTKNFLLGAKMISGARFNDGSVGSWILRAFDQMGITDKVLPKYRSFATGTEMINAVVTREAEAVLSVMPDLADSAIIDYAGPFPQEIQQYEIARAAITTQSRHPIVGRDLIAFIQSPDNKELIQQKWLYPIH